MPIADAGEAPDWLHGEGRQPAWGWGFRPDGPLAAMAYARESGDTYALDEKGHLYRLDRGGRLASVNRLPDRILDIAWSDDGSLGAAVVDERTLMTLTGDLKVRWKLDVPDDILGIAVDPFGQYVALSMADAGNFVYTRGRHRVAAFSTIRPLTYLEWLCHEPMLLGAAEHGLLCCHSLGGERLWEEKILSNCGAMATAGDGRRTLMAGFTHGVQVFDEIGETIGAYILDGAAAIVACSFTAERIMTSTLERQLFWMDEDGDLLWFGTLPEDPVELIVDPLGDWGLVAMPGEGVCKLNWD